MINAKIIFLAVGLTLVFTLVVSTYKFACHRSSSARVVFWICVVALTVLLAVDDRFGITQRETSLPPAPLIAVDERGLAAAFRDTEFELLKYDEIDAVTFNADRETGEFVIRLAVNDSADEKFLSEIRDETMRIFLRAMVDNCEIPTLIGSRSFLSQLRIAVVLIRSNNEQALPSGKGFFICHVCALRAT